MLFLLYGRLDTKAAENTHQIEITLDKISSAGLDGDETLSLVMWDSGENQIELTREEEKNQEIRYKCELAPGNYTYTVQLDESTTYGSGALTVQADTTKIYLHSIDFSTIIYGADLAEMKVSLKHQSGKTYQPGTAGRYGLYFYVPAYNGDSYYEYVLAPNDTDKYVSQKGHVYVYAVKDNVFKRMNLSDGHVYSLMEKHEFVAKVPKRTEIYHIDQSKFYMARDYEPLKKLEERSQADAEYDYYETNYAGQFMLRKEGKVTRYCNFPDQYRKGITDFGEWNAEKTEFTFRELTDNSKQITRTGNGYYDANVTSSSDMSQEIKLEQGEYYDLVNFRSWQAISNAGSNSHFEPDYHYIVLGDAVTVEQTADDLNWQYGRIKGLKNGVSVVLYTYDAMEWDADSKTNTDAYGYMCYSAMWPENTGIQIVEVGANKSGIKDGIELEDLDTIYYLKTQTNADGTKVTGKDYGEYSFTPTSEYAGDTISVRVHDPYQIENGVLNIQDETDWQQDSQYWTTYQADENGKFNIRLKEGRNIIEISTEHGKVYRVITAKPVELTITNESRAGQTLSTGDTAKIHFDGFSSVVYKLGAIYNPTYDKPTWKLNQNEEFYLNTEQWAISKTSNQTLYLGEAGVYSFTDGVIQAAAYTAEPEELGKAYRQMTRCSKLESAYNGQLSDIKSADRCILPDFSFDVEDSGDLEEENNRTAGELTSLKLGIARNTKLVKNYLNATTEVRPTSISVTAVTKDPNAKIYARTWKWGEERPTTFQEITSGSAAVLGKANLKNEAAMTEVLVIPEKGYPQVYSWHVYGATQFGTSKKNSPLIGDIKITNATDGAVFEKYDGILQCDVSGNSAKTLSGESIPVDSLGYGFLAGEEEFSTSVPFETEEANISLFNTMEKELQLGDITSRQITIKSKGEDGTEKEYPYGTAVNLSVGDNVFYVTQTSKAANFTLNYCYKINIIRRSAAKKVSFSIPEDATIMVMDEKEKLQKANEDGTYTLNSGTYTYYVSKVGYITKIDKFEINDENPIQNIKVDELEAVPEQSGAVSVRIAGQNTVLRPTADVEIPKEIKDLKAYWYVKYNYGGYTALHALLDACEEASISFQCSKGKLTLLDDSAIGATGANAGWICEINGAVCKDPANTLVNDGDKIEYYYNSDLTGMTYAWLTPEQKEVDRGTEVTLMLLGKNLSVENAGYSAVAGAEIYDGNKSLGTTNELGQFVIDTNGMTLGTHYLTATLKNDEGQNLLTAVMSTITVKKVEDPDAAPNTTTVTFRLIGDTKHGEDENSGTAHRYTTWLATDTYTFEGDEVTVGDVFKAALDEAGITYYGLEKNYISAITAPEACSGYILSEKDNGQNSGWMYTVNGTHPSIGLNDWYVSTGDEIIWHYIDDYKIEQSDMKNDDGSYGTTGNASTWNKWLEALDETPGAREKAAEVGKKIAAIGTEITLTDECEEKITAAREAYDALTREEKSYVENYGVLQEKEEDLAALKKEKADKEAADAVIAIINALPDAKNLTLENQEAVANAGKAYRELTPDQKMLVDKDAEGETYKKLYVAEGVMAELLGDEAVRLVVKELTALPEAADVKLEDEAALSAAYDHFMALTEEQRGMVEEALQTKLSDAIDQLNLLKQEAAEKEAVDKVNELLNSLPSEDEVLFADQTDIEAARAAYEALDTLKDQVSPDALAKLTTAENRLNALQEEVNQVVDLIDALPAVDELTPAHADQVKAARDAYNALNNDQKRLLTENGVLSKLLVAENQMSWLQKDVEAAKKVTDRINSLPAVKDLKLADKTAVQAARNAYEGLSDAQKKYVSAETLKILTDCEAEIARLEAMKPTPSPDPDPNPTPTPTPDPEPSDKTMTLTYQNYPISVTGKLSGYELRLVGLKAADDSVKRMQNKISTKEALIRLYDVKLYLNGEEVDWDEQITVNFQVGDKYNGKKLTVLHDVDGSIEKLKGTVSDGILSVTADSLSPFGVVVTASTVTGNGVTNSNSTTTNTTTTVTNGNLNGTTNNTSAEGVTGNVTSAQTGDDTDILLPVAGLIAASGVLAGVVLYYKKKRKNTGVQTEEEK